MHVLFSYAIFKQWKRNKRWTEEEDRRVFNWKRKNKQTKEWSELTSLRRGVGASGATRNSPLCVTQLLPEKERGTEGKKKKTERRERGGIDFLAFLAYHEEQICAVPSLETSSFGRLQEGRGWVTASWSRRKRWLGSVACPHTHVNPPPPPPLPPPEQPANFSVQFSLHWEQAKQNNVLIKSRAEGRPQRKGCSAAHTPNATKKECF